MKSKLSQLLLFLCFVALFFVLSEANIYGQIYPFAFSMFFALAWANQKVYLLAPAFFIGQVILNHTFEDIISSLVTIFMLVVPYYIHILTNRPMKKFELFIFSALSPNPLTISVCILLGFTTIVLKFAFGTGNFNVSEV